MLLSKGRWDKEQLIRDLQEQWNITVQESDEDGEKRDDALVFDVGDKIAAISLMPFPIPNNEAETNAENNWMWPEAVNAAKEHCAHIMVAVCGGKDDDLIERWQAVCKTNGCVLPSAIRYRCLHQRCSFRPQVLQEGGRSDEGRRSPDPRLDLG